MASVAVAAVWLVVASSASMALRHGARSLACQRVVAGSRREAASGGTSGHRRLFSQTLTAAAGRRRSSRATRQDLIVVVDELTSALASGASSTQAMVAASRLPGPLAADLAHAATQVRHGRGVQEVIDAWAGVHADCGTALVADALALADATGGSRVSALGGVRSTLREAEGLTAEIRALAAQTRLSATVLTVLPVGFAVLVAAADSRIASFLLTSPAGWFCMVGGVALDGFGAWWMQRLTGALR